MTSFGVAGNQFVMDNKPFRILSGALHYFRVVPDYWEDRLLKLKAMGLNTVETYVAWNLHEPQPGEFCFSGMLDIERFVRLAGDLGLKVIVRPGPYICAEWEFGGLPAWLLADPQMKLRCSYPPYLEAVHRFFSELLPRLAPLQTTHGGPIIAVQVENEYGSYGCDKDYLRYLEELTRAQDIDVLLFTSDGPTDSMLQGGTLPHLLKVANFGSNAERGFAKLREYQPEGPLMCGEFWNGWFDHWGTKHHTRAADDAAAVLDAILAQGASVNIYMFHGGTNFGFMNGANHHGEEYLPTVNSYDYDAPLSESGDPTPKFYAFQAVLAKYADVTAQPVPALPAVTAQPAPALPAVVLKKAYGVVALNEVALLFSNLTTLSKPVHRPTPEPMEMLGQSYGFILYRTSVSGPREAATLSLQDVHDRALVFLDGEYKGVVAGDKKSDISLELCSGPHQLDILVENMGRINYGPWLHDRKGITHGVRLDRQFLHGWTIYPLPLDDFSNVEFKSLATTGSPICPAFYRGEFVVDEPTDTFIALPGWTKGVCWLNGFNLGRYWERGPQKTLYVPGPLLRNGQNEVMLFELHDVRQNSIEFREQPDLG
jgi:beta-galactosidase